MHSIRDGYHHTHTHTHTYRERHTPTHTHSNTIEIKAFRSANKFQSFITPKICESVQYLLVLVWTLYWFWFGTKTGIWSEFLLRQKFELSIGVLITNMLLAMIFLIIIFFSSNSCIHFMHKKFKSIRNSLCMRIKARMHWYFNHQTMSSSCLVELDIKMPEVKNYEHKSHASSNTNYALWSNYALCTMSHTTNYRYIIFNLIAVGHQTDFVRLESIRKFNWIGFEFVKLDCIYHCYNRNCAYTLSWNSVICDQIYVSKQQQQQNRKEKTSCYASFYLHIKFQH